MSKWYTEEGLASYRYLIEDAIRPVSFVYFAVESGEANRLVKIGTTAKTPHARLNDLQIGNWRELLVRQVIIGDELDEEKIHLAFAEDRIRGEWFGNGNQILEFADKVAELQCRLRLRKLCVEKTEDERDDADYERLMNSLMIVQGLEAFGLVCDCGVVL